MGLARNTWSSSKRSYERLEERVRAQPEPPRSIGLGEVAKSFFEDPAMMIGFVLLFSATVAPTGAMFMMKPDAVQPDPILGLLALLQAALMLACVALLIGYPVIAIRRLRRAFTLGVLARARVGQIVMRKQRNFVMSPEDEWEVKAELEVEHPQGTFISRNEIKGAWNSEVKSGDEIEVLVDTGNRKVLWVMRDRLQPHASHQQLITNG